MAVYRFSALRDGQSVSFDPTADVFSFDVASIAAVDLRITASGFHTRIEAASSPTAPLELTASNLNFADVAGDSGWDGLAGFGGSDGLHGALGSDTYAVSAGDALVSSAVELFVPLRDHPAASPIDAPPIDAPPIDPPASDPRTGGTGPVIIGTAGDDTLTATAGNDTVYGGAGNDTLLATGRGHAGTLLDGGSGNDTYVVNLLGWDTEPAPTLVDAAGIDTVITALDWTLGADFENLTIRGGVGEAASGFGNALDNRIIADSTSHDSLAVYGRGGNDTLIGGGGSDELFGEQGDDRLEFSVDTYEWNMYTGGEGADTFVFRGVTDESGMGDAIADFVTGVDKIVFDSTGFTAIGRAGNFSAGDGRFYAAAGAMSAQDADDRVIYDSSSGRLYYDEDGSGGVPAYLVATLGGAPALTVTDLAIL